MVVDAALLERAGELKRELVEFSQQPRYERAVSRFLEEYGGGTAVFDEQRMMLLWDSFVLEHKLANGRTVVEQFVDASPGLSGPEREMLLGRRDVVQGPFEVERRDGTALLVTNLVDNLSYRVRSNMGTAVFRQMPRQAGLLRPAAAPPREPGERTAGRLRRARMADVQPGSGTGWSQAFAGRPISSWAPHL
jgi:hypothetical protein